jgi:hypothetical protein
MNYYINMVGSILCPDHLDSYTSKSRSSWYSQKAEARKNADPSSSG